MRDFKFAVVGIGNIGRRHMAVIDGTPHAINSAYCDIDTGAFERQKTLYPGLPFYTDYGKMLEETDAEIVNVCTPHFLHKEMTIQAAEKGKHILVEKPMSLKEDEGREMIAAAKANNVQLFVVKQNRYNIPIQLTKDALDKGRLGRIFKVQCNVLWNRYQGYYDDSPWRGDIKTEGGALYTQVSHFIDLLIWWFGEISDIKTITECQNHKIEIEDNGSTIFKFANGAMGMIDWTTNVYNKNFEGSIIICGEYGTIKIGGQYLNKIEYWDVQSYPLQEGIEFVDKPNAYGKYQGTSSNHDKVIADLMRSLSHEENISVHGEEGLLSVKAIEQIYLAENK